jgi:hypothetical protein
MPSWYEGDDWHKFAVPHLHGSLKPHDLHRIGLAILL